jgi:hypothetical protein
MNAKSMQWAKNIIQALDSGQYDEFFSDDKRVRYVAEILEAYVGELKEMARKRQ